ncbi:MAG: NUDIX domain-containing protein [Candidatus Nanohalobium sp.]
MADKMYAGVKALIERDGEYLFVGFELDGEMLWILPGGRLEHGEAPLEGLRREVKGETSLEIEPGKPVGMYHFFRGPEDDGDQVTLTVFDVKSFSGEVNMDTEHAEEDELKDYRWMTPEEIMEENTTETLKQMLRKRVF